MRSWKRSRLDLHFGNYTNQLPTKQAISHVDTKLVWDTSPRLVSPNRYTERTMSLAWVYSISGVSWPPTAKNIPGSYPWQSFQWKVSLCLCGEGCLKLAHRSVIKQTKQALVWSQRINRCDWGILQKVTWRVWKRSKLLITTMYYNNAFSFCFTADRFSVEFYPSYLLSDQPPYFCICIYFFLSIPTILVNYSLMRACKVAGVVVCPRFICLLIPKVDRPLFLKPSRLTVRFLFRRTCWFKVLFQLRSIPKSICDLWCEE